MTRQMALVVILAAGLTTASSAVAQEQRPTPDNHSRTEQQLAEIKNELARIRAETADIRKQLRKLLDRRWQYTTAAPNRMKSRDRAQFFNEMSAKGWELFLMLPDGEFVFRKPVDAR